MRRLDIWFMFCIVAVLALPSIGLGWKSARILAAPGLSAEGSGPAETSWTSRADVFIATNHGFRKNMLQMSRDIHNALSGASPRVLHGREEWLFLTDSDALSQATGQRLDVEGLKQFVALASGLAAEARTGGRQFLVAIAPNKHTIYRDKLPQWASAVPSRTEHDVLLDALALAGVAAVDLRPGLQRSAHARPVYFRGDTHWTEFGAAIAFNDIVRALGLADEAIDLDAAFAADVPRDRPGDLVKLAGIAGPWIENVPSPREGTFVADARLERQVLRKVGDSEFYRLTHRSPAGHPATGPRVLVVGDSFTADLFGPMFMRFASEYVWMHNLGGSIDTGLIAESDPDIIVLEVVERLLPFLRFRPSQSPSAGG